MRDLNKTIEHIEQRTWGTRKPSASAADNPKSSPRAWRAPDVVQRPASAAEREAHRQFGGGEASNRTVVARAVKVTIPLQPATVVALGAPESGPSRIKLTV